MRIVLVVEYNGTEYSGWQRQPGLRTVQGVLENSISIVANHPVETSCSGRTDKGVHAFQQFVHFDSDAVRDEDSWLRGINSNLPSTIKVRDVVFSNPEFHARHSSNARTPRRDQALDQSGSDPSVAKVALGNLWSARPCGCQSQQQIS